MNKDEDDSGILFRDVITLALAGFVCIAILLLPHINPPTVTSSGRDANESVIFEISWPHETNADIDLWVRAPGDVAVGYSNKGGLSCNLLRDDLGNLADPLQINHEETVCRGLVKDQRYTVNIHAFRAAGVTWPIEVNMVVRVKKGLLPIADIVTSHAKLLFLGEEVTMANFELDENGGVKQGTLDAVQVPLRAFTSK